MSETPFWQSKALDEMSESEWESLCDGCGLCCLHKLEDEDSGHVYLTSISCRYLSPECRCMHYAERVNRVPGCLKLSPESLEHMVEWLPSSCAYKRLQLGQSLPSWHPLVVQQTQVIKPQYVLATDLVTHNETQLPEDDWQNYIIQAL